MPINSETAAIDGLVGITQTILLDIQHKIRELDNDVKHYTSTVKGLEAYIFGMREELIKLKQAIEARDDKQYKEIVDALNKQQVTLNFLLISLNSLTSRMPDLFLE